MDPALLSTKERVSLRKELHRNNRVFPLRMVELPEGSWPERSGASVRPVRVFRSRTDLVQMFAEEHGAIRLSITSCDFRISDGEWLEGYTWDRLMEIKAECGFADRWAVEIYPPAASVVNVANMRHLWLLREAPPFAWKKRETPALEPGQPSFGRDTRCCYGRNNTAASPCPQCGCPF
jgi:hypothetical protein